MSEQTREQILCAAWDLMAGEGRLHVGMAEVARAAGVSRQAVFYAVGNRAGLLLAMVRYRDASGPHADRLAAIARQRPATPATLHTFVDTWVDYLPVVYPVAIQLECSSLEDEEARAAWHDRLFVGGLRRGLQRIVDQLAEQGRLRPGLTGATATDLCLTWLLPSAWRFLVVELAWKPEDFRASRHDLVATVLNPDDRSAQ